MPITLQSFPNPVTFSNFLMQFLIIPPSLIIIIARVGSKEVVHSSNGYKMYEIQCNAYHMPITLQSQKNVGTWPHCQMLKELTFMHRSSYHSMVLLSQASIPKRRTMCYIAMQNYQSASWHSILFLISLATLFGRVLHSKLLPWLWVTVQWNPSG